MATSARCWFDNVATQLQLPIADILERLQRIRKQMSHGHRTRTRTGTAATACGAGSEIAPHLPKAHERSRPLQREPATKLLDRVSGVHHKSGDFCRIAGEIMFLLAEVRRSRLTQQSSVRLEASGGFPRVACHRRHQRNGRGRRRELQEQRKSVHFPTYQQLKRVEPALF
jgi:hypothetical protein